MIPGQVALRPHGFAGVPVVNVENACAGGATALWLAIAHVRSGLSDVARRDDDGLITIIDRIKDTIVTGGFDVYPREVEDALATHPAVAACAVYGTPDPRWGEAVTATVVLRPGQHATPAELMDHVRARKGTLWVPKRLHLADALPLTALGEIDRRRLSNRP
ncbi:hypothetical protein ACIQOW_19730 [Kitasatospora sp. NPDC091335]|uniref:AMP-binding enzyme n=1 Tax=Kitasatospora sp. NPDC091335 TaxID=3364085 RepID=UPI0038133D35